MSGTKKIVQIPVIAQVEVPLDWSEADIMDVIRFHLDLSDLSDVEADVADCEITNVKPAPIQPGDLVEHATKDLDPREVVAVGRDWLTLDIGGETTRIPKDNYRVYSRTEGAL